MSSWFYHLPIPERPTQQRLKLTDQIVFLGSCFADHMRLRMQQHGLHTVADPFGPLYHPLPMADIFAATFLHNRPATAEDIFFSQATQKWHHLGLHGRFADSDQHNLLQRVNDSLTTYRQSCRQAQVCIITFGTAEGYHHHSQPSQTVGNCHRIPSTEFTKLRHGPDALLQRWLPLLTETEKHYPHLEYIFTVSPVRYGSNNPHAHTCSKASLHLFIDEMMAQAPNPTWYFPAYEIWLDELRDYRFYKADKKHPSDEAIDYAWSRFIEAAIDPSALPAMKAFHQAWKKLGHRGLPTSTQQEIIQDIAKTYPQLNWPFLQTNLQQPP